ncbi:YifB family Mg chelatase-like AAA ATPase [Candidatus Cytomitobacter indipagum]|uniref:YifB family Mg chelatase-like AAA ATPase n=1 Tax=Candidatus Cytomitobacter indipagum TaxID=2601575 RepID=A0A5C0UDR4_9PROT|nr:YifB family Mg chelatase-like AAA ATPase [Candidatus Cytomitobacter indipagum]QEK37830.1 YifB family Mg chelatase-like AAA ATPase [Candidatus Cytomitobacter indipagum]
MSVATVSTVSFRGMDIVNIEIQAYIGPGLPAFHIVGLADKAVTESRERIRSAFQSIGLALPAKRIVINMSPADIQKEGNHYDLPIILAILGALDIISKDYLNEWIIMGEISLDAKINHVAGSLLAAVHAAHLKKGLICPSTCAGEAKWGGDLKILAPSNLVQLMNHIKGIQICLEPHYEEEKKIHEAKDFSEVRGHESIKRALEVAAAGRHHVLMIGPPGAGKSMLASRMNTILPELTPREALEVSMIYSISNLNKAGLIKRRPFRSPHHNSSLPSVIGGGHKCRPGEISLAHHGVLFMDELSLWAPSVLNGLRESIETGNIFVARANASIKYPARFQLIAAMNPCICGHAYDLEKRCSKFPNCYTNYLNKIPGPIWDRFGIIVSIDKLSPWELSEIGDKSKSSAEMKEVVTSAVNVQQNRYKDKDFKCNNDVPSSKIDILNILQDSMDVINKYAKSVGMSNRRYYNTAKIARTIADIESSEFVQIHHMQEAISYNMFQKSLVNISE